MTPTSKRQDALGILATALLGLFTFIYLLPVVLLAINSFKTYREIFTSYTALPGTFSLENYFEAWKSLKFGSLLVNNLLITTTTIVLVLVVTSLAGYKLSRTKSRLSGLLYLVFTFPFLIPQFAYMIPLVKLMKDLGLLNNVLSVILMYVSTSSFSIFLIHGYVKSIPFELEESAAMEGSSEVSTFFRIIFPLLKPALVSIAVFYALWTWNDFLLPFLLLTGQGSKTIMISIYEMFGKYGSDWNTLIAGLCLASIPIITLYGLMQRFIITGVTAGAVKG